MAQMSAIHHALQEAGSSPNSSLFADVANITFTYAADITGPASMVFGQAHWANYAPGFGAEGYFPDIATLEPDDDPNMAGDVVFNSDNDDVVTGSYAPGSANYALVLHEIGHAVPGTLSKARA